MAKNRTTSPAPVATTPAIVETTESTTQVEVTEVPPTPTTPELTTAQKRDLYLREKRQAKLAEKQAAKVALAAKRADGIIGTLRSALETEQGTTKTEIMATLTAKFADRDPLGMVVTVGIQLSRLPKALGRTMLKEKIEGRGLVYRFAPVVVTTPEA